MDPIADFLIALKNASMARRKTVSMPYSRVRHEIARVLAEEGFVGRVNVSGKEKKNIEVEITYDESGNPRINHVRRISKPSRRVYYPVKKITPVRQGYGLIVFSTPKGIMSGSAARREHVGGEALFTIW